MTRVILPTLAALFLGLACIPGFAATEIAVLADDGAAIYAQSCGKCHDAGVARAPDRTALKLLSVDRVRNALIAGSMREQAAGFSASQLDALARWVGGAGMASAAGNAGCAPDNTPADTPADTRLTGALAGPHWNGWGAGPTQRRYQSAAMAGLAAADVPKLELKWAFGFADSTRAFAQPTVVGGRVYVGSATGKVYSLDAATGCVHWEFAAAAPVRTAISIGQGSRGWTAYFGDQRGNAYGVDALTGKPVWTTRVDTHNDAQITGAPLLQDDRLLVPVASREEATSMNPNYACCTFRGSIVALDAQTGERLWQAYAIAAEPQPQLQPANKNEKRAQLFGPAGASIWSAPTFDPDKRRVYVTTGNGYTNVPSDGANAFVAFNWDDGARVWAKQITANDGYTMSCETNAPGGANCPKVNGPDVDFGSSAMLVTLPNGRRALIAGQKSGDVHAIDPDADGAVLWRTMVGMGGKLGGVQWGTAADEQQVYVAVSDVRLAGVAPGTPGSQPTSFGFSLRLDPAVGGGLLALKIDTGEVVWKTPHPGCAAKPGCSPAQSAAVTAIPGVVFSGGLDGHLRGYAADNGQIIWDSDTKKSYTTVNGVVAQGGSLDGPGAVVVAGTVYVNSGYAIFGGIPGNVLLAYSVGGK